MRLRLGHFALLIALSGCARASFVPTSTDPSSLTVALSPGTAADPYATAARNRFSQDAFCPRGRVGAVTIVPMGTPPPEIAHDAERMKLWREASLHKAQTEPRKYVTAKGCGEERFYWCWDVTMGSVPSSRSGWKWHPSTAEPPDVYGLGATCVEEPKPTDLAASAVPF